METGYYEFLNMPLTRVMAEGDEIRQRYAGNRIEVSSRIVVNLSSCEDSCEFCSRLIYTGGANRKHPLIPETVFEAAARARSMGAQVFEIASCGNRLTEPEFAVVSELVYQISTELGLNSSAALGKLSFEQLLKLKNAGLHYYHHPIETSPAFYDSIHSSHNFEDRILTLNAAKAAGLSVISGGTIGLGESWPDRIEMAQLLADLSVNTVELNFVSAVTGGTVPRTDPVSIEDAIRTLALFRIILKDIPLIIAAGRESVLKNFQGAGFMAGANGLTLGNSNNESCSVSDEQNLIKEIEILWTDIPV